MTLIDLPRLRNRLTTDLGLPDASVEVEADGEGHVHVRLPSLSGRLRRRACAICRLALPRAVQWTIRETDD